jgi:hypothetical protein
MATINSAKRNTSLVLDAGDKNFARVIDMSFDFSADGTMGTATDVINLMTLPAGAVVLALSVQQTTIGTGTGTVVGRVGTTTLTGTLASTAAVSTLAATTPATIPYVVAAGGEELNLLGATAVRIDGKVRVFAVVVEGDKTPRYPTTVLKDAS